MSDDGEYSKLSTAWKIIKINSIPDMPKLLQEDCSSDSSDEEKWEESEEEAEVTKCLFSDKVFPSLDDAIRHLKTSYNFDLAEMKLKYSMDFYSYMKVCNQLQPTS